MPSQLPPPEKDFIYNTLTFAPMEGLHMSCKLCGQHSRRTGTEDESRTTPLYRDRGCGHFMHEKCLLNWLVEGLYDTECHGCLVLKQAAQRTEASAISENQFVARLLRVEERDVQRLISRLQCQAYGLQKAASAGSTTSSEGRENSPSSSDSPPPDGKTKGANEDGKKNTKRRVTFSDDGATDESPKRKYPVEKHPKASPELNRRVTFSDDSATDESPKR